MTSTLKSAVILIIGGGVFLVLKEDSEEDGLPGSFNDIYIYIDTENTEAVVRQFKEICKRLENYQPLNDAWGR